MRKIVICMSAGIAGSDGYEFWEFPDSVTEKELEDFAWQSGVQHADMYGIYPEQEYTEDEVAADPDSYSSDIEGYWVEYDSKEHDGHSMTGTPQWNQA